MQLSQDIHERLKRPRTTASSLGVPRGLQLLLNQLNSLQCSTDSVFCRAPLLCGGTELRGRPRANQIHLFLCL